MKRKMSKFKIAIIAVAAVVVLSVGGTFAYLRATTNTATNAFEHGVINITIQENFPDPNITADGVVKEVKIKNDSLSGTLNVAPCYVRVALEMSWVYDDGKVAPVTQDQLEQYVTFTMPENSKWIKGSDGFYYYPDLLEKDQETGLLIEKVALSEDAPTEGHLEINVLADGIQKNEVNSAWNNPTAKVGNTSIYAVSEE